MHWLAEVKVVTYDRRRRWWQLKVDKHDEDDGNLQFQVSGTTIEKKRKTLRRGTTLLRPEFYSETCARCLDFSSFCALSPFSSCATIVHYGTTLHSLTSPEKPKSRSCARYGTTLRSLTSPEKPKSRSVNLDGRRQRAEPQRPQKRDFGFSGDVREQRVVPQRAQEWDFGFSGDARERMVVPHRVVVAQEENGDSVQKEEKSRQRAQVSEENSGRRRVVPRRRFFAGNRSGGWFQGDRG
ncbi:Uncharacterized protein Fot_21849 [Forsythia ovata]|uniref:Uncharacterized protein n=1 Tax=Forsythia ovata TaxID=205694 RepID=A0ABD1UXX1_9LAMI